MLVFVHKNGAQLGPLDLNEVNARIARGELEGSDPAWIEGWTGWQTLSSVPGFTPRLEPPPFVLEDSLPRVPAVSESAAQIGSPPVMNPAEPIFFYIPRVRLIVMSVLTFGIYTMLWSYRNWRFLQKRDYLHISPFWRGWFSVFFIYSLFKKIKSDPEINHHVHADFSPGGLTTGWIIFTYLGNVFFNKSLPLELQFCFGGICCLAAVLCLLPAQTLINRANESALIRPPYHGWSTGQVIMLVVAICSWPLIIYGMTLTT
jgi:hypothetical protein